MKTLFTLLLASSSAIASDGPVREITSQAERVANVPLPAFQKGYIYTLDHAAVRLFRPQGDPAFVRVLQLPNGNDPRTQGLAVDSDGSAAVSVTSQTPAGFTGGIVFLDKNGIQTAFVDTGLYEASNLTYGEDHALWTFGWQRDAAKQAFPDRQDYMMVRRYSPDRKEAGRYLARSLFPKGLEPGMPSWQRLRIAVSRDKVGLVAWSGETSSRPEWVELKLDGTLIRRVPIDHPGSLDIAFTADGRLYRKEQRSAKLQVLDPNTPEWDDAGISPDRHLMGADGDLLVFSPGGDGPIELQWFPQPATH